MCLPAVQPTKRPGIRDLPMPPGMGADDGDEDEEDEPEQTNLERRLETELSGQEYDCERSPVG